MDDYAVVVGISRYPGLRDPSGEAAHLDGPDNDAQSIYDWLVDPAGGGLDLENVKLIRSADFQNEENSDRQPEHRKIVEEFEKLEERAYIDSTGSEQIPVGRRLYIYMSGHGFAPKPDEGALFTADARSPNRTVHIYANAWLTWFRMAGYFEECVLWMDCCVEWQLLTMPETVPWRIKRGPNPPGPAFIAVAARSGKKAIERPMEDGKVHGVFTWTLLKGLRGGATDSQGRITGESLAGYLYNSMRDFLPEEVQAGLEVDVRPFVRADPGMEFGAVAARPRYGVHLGFPAEAEAQEARIWGGAPYALVTSALVTQRGWTGPLERGLYAVDVPVAGLRQGFEVTGSGDVEVQVTERGPAVNPASASAASHVLDLRTDNPAATINLIDWRYERILAGTGGSWSRQPPGVYKIRVQFGREVGAPTDRIVLLDRDLAESVPSPPLASPAPIPGSALTHEYHVAAYESVTRDLPAMGHGSSRLSIMARYWTDRQRRWDSGLHFPHPLDGIVLVTARGRRVADLRAIARSDARNGIDPFAVCALGVEPGPYFVRHALADGRVVEQTLVASPGWETQLVIRRATSDTAADPAVARITAVGDLTILMRRAGHPDPGEDALLEAAHIALAQDRDILGEERGGSQLEDVLLRKCDNPVAGIIGAHLLLLAIERAGGTPDPARRHLLDEVVSNLRRLVGEGYPDVEALSLRCADPAVRTKLASFEVPPMFRHSWQLLVEATAEPGRRGLVPPALWRRVHAIMPMVPYLVWAQDTKTKLMHERKLKTWIKEAARIEARADGRGPPARRRPIVPPAMAMAAMDVAAGAPSARRDPDRRPAEGSSEAFRARVRVLQLPAAVLDEISADYAPSDPED